MVVFAAAGGHAGDARAELSHQVAAAITPSAVLLTAALSVAIFLIVRQPASDASPSK